MHREGPGGPPGEKRMQAAVEDPLGAYIHVPWRTRRSADSINSRGLWRQPADAVFPVCSKGRTVLGGWLLVSTLAGAAAYCAMGGAAGQRHGWHICNRESDICISGGQEKCLQDVNFQIQENIWCSSGKKREREITLPPSENRAHAHGKHAADGCFRKAAGGSRASGAERQDRLCDAGPGKPDCHRQGLA